MDDLTERLTNALSANHRVIRRVMLQLMSEAWDEGTRFVLDNGWVDGDDSPPNPYRVAAPEGDGGNE